MAEAASSSRPWRKVADYRGVVKNAAAEYEDVKDRVVMADAMPAEEDHSHRVADAAGDHQRKGDGSETFVDRLYEEVCRPSP